MLGTSSQVHRHGLSPETVPRKSFDVVDLRPRSVAIYLAPLLRCSVSARLKDMHRHSPVRLVWFATFLCGFLVLAGTASCFAQAAASKAHDVEATSAAPSSRPEDVPERAVELDELAPAALTLDQAGSPPLIRALYQATRETKEQPTLQQIVAAKQILDAGADVNAVDANGRTALHWMIFGASSATKPSILVAYEDVTDDLIRRGVEINRKDSYDQTALDYLLYSPSFEMETLLLEAGASSGFGSAPRAGSGSSTGPLAVKGSGQELSPGKTLSIRLDVPVYSDRSRTGDPVTGTVTYPLCRSGEDIACPPGELLVAPGTKVRGVVLFAQRAPDKYWRPRLVLNFAKIVNPDGSLSDLHSRVLNVDNARETVRNNEIFGIIQPHANSKTSLALSAVGVINPVAGYAVRGVQAVYGLSIRREILFPPGTDLQVQIIRPSVLEQEPSWAGWPLMEASPELQKIVSTAPGRVTTPGGAPSDLTNLMFIGTRQQLLAAFGDAGWYEADDLSIKSGLNTIQATLRSTDYVSAPVSSLLIGGRPPDLVFQKSLDTFAQRHHVRIWKQTVLLGGREVWVGAATHDIAVSNSRAKTKWSHRVDTHVDRERDWIQSDLLYAGTAVAYVNIDRADTPRRTSNATGDALVTDGKMAVVELGGGALKTPSSTGLQSRQSTK